MRKKIKAKGLIGKKPWNGITKEDEKFVKMSREQARIIILEAELAQAYHTVSFLHSCLTEEGYSYGYPEQTIERLAKWKKMIRIRPGCIHSHTEPGCKSCKERDEFFMKLFDAKEVLGLLD